MSNKPHTEKPEPTRQELFKAHAEACRMLNEQSIELERVNELNAKLQQTEAYWRGMFKEGCRLLRINSEHLTAIGAEMKTMLDSIGAEAAIVTTPSSPEPILNDETTEH